MVFVMLQRVVQREPLSFLLVHCILLEDGKSKVNYNASMTLCGLFVFLGKRMKRAGRTMAQQCREEKTNGDTAPSPGQMVRAQ